jgi:nucleolar pre-ribosomal-associated protein 1
VASSSANPEVNPVKAVLRTVLVEKGVLSNESRAFDTLLASLNSSKKWSPSPAIYTFIDNCIGRVVRQPVHYLDLTTSSRGEDAGISSSGTLVMCIAEQWPFLAKNDDLDVQKNVAEWIARFIAAPGLDEEDVIRSKIGKIVDDMITIAHGTPGPILEKAFKKQSKHPIKLEPLEVPDEPQTNGDIEMEKVKEKRLEIVLEDIFGLPKRSPDSLQGLDQWENADLESAITSGQLSRLLQCVASAEEETRRQAFLTLRQLMAVFKV